MPDSDQASPGIYPGSLVQREDGRRNNLPAQSDKANLALPSLKVAIPEFPLI